MTKRSPGSEESGLGMRGIITSRADYPFCAAGLRLQCSGAFQGSSESIQSSPLLSMSGSSSNRKVGRTQYLISLLFFLYAPRDYAYEIVNHDDPMFVKYCVGAATNF